MEPRMATLLCLAPRSLLPAGRRRHPSGRLLAGSQRSCETPPMVAHGKGEPVAPGEGASSPGRDPLERLHAVPWEALRGLADPVHHALGRILGGGSAERAVDALLRKHRTIDGPRRAALAEAIFGVALWRRRLARAAGLPRWEGADPALLLCALLRSLASVPEE